MWTAWKYLYSCNRIKASCLSRSHLYWFLAARLQLRHLLSLKLTYSVWAQPDQRFKKRPEDTFWDLVPPHTYTSFSGWVGKRISSVPLTPSYFSLHIFINSINSRSSSGPDDYPFTSREDEEKKWRGHVFHLRSNCKCGGRTLVWAFKKQDVVTHRTESLTCLLPIFSYLMQSWDHW